MPNKINSTILLIIIAAAGLVMAAPAQVQGITLDIRISNADDDAQQDGARTYLDLNELDLGDEQEEIGLRFVNVTVPKNSTITNAYVEFTAYETRDKNPDVDIYGHDVGDAPAFEAVDNNIENRINNFKTSEKVQ
jgi:hypothetical protein